MACLKSFLPAPMPVFTIRQEAGSRSMVLTAAAIAAPVGEMCIRDRGYCPVQMIWQHPELAVNPRLRMGAVLNEGGPVEERIVRGLGIESGWLDRYPGELSGGELQRFCIARALGSGTRFLLADEITTMLDLITQSQIWQFLGEEVGRRGLGLMVVSHSQALMDRLCGSCLLYTSRCV